MDCSEIKIAMHQYFDGDLDEPGLNSMEEHMGRCAACRSHFSELIQVEMRLIQQEWMRGPAEFTDGLMRRLPERPFRLENWRFLLRRTAGIAVAIAFFIGVGIWWSAPQGFSVQASGSKGLVVANRLVVVPKGQEYKGNLVVQNGDAEIWGKVDGNVTALGGHVYQKDGSRITGDREEVIDTYQWVLYYAKKIWDSLLTI